MEPYTAPRGTFDVIPGASGEERWRNSFLWQHIESVLRQTARDFGFYEIRTPAFERTELFTRTVGEGSDIVSKEMYTFIDRGDRSMTLRPEGTAAALRSFIENRLDQTPYHKVFYIAPMFRYERPQKGRYRQHHQFGAEVIGIASPEQDAELIAFAYTIYQKLGITALNVNINSVGDLESRTAYKAALSAYLEPRLQELSEDSRERFSKNMLRILDSKAPQDQEILKTAPKLLDFLSQTAKSHFDRVLSLLTSLNIPYTIDPKLVRGLDYYNHTVFEVTSTGLGSQNAIGGGGRYDGLVKELRGPDLPSVGFGMGLERILHTLLHAGAPLPSPDAPALFLIPMDDKSAAVALEIALKLRRAELYTEIDLSLKKIKHGLKLASDLGALYSMVIGETEVTSQKGSLKNMATREAREISFAELEVVLKSALR